MACSLTITSVAGVGVPGGTPSIIRVSGTAVDCTAVSVLVYCRGTPFAGSATVAADGAWSAELPVPSGSGCQCGGNIVVQAVCTADPSCGTSVSGSIECTPGGGCPRVTVDVSTGGCNADGSRSVTFNPTITPATPDIVVAHWAFGDGHLSAPILVPGPPASRTHGYVPGIAYTAELIIDSPEGCRPTEVPVGPLPPCACPEVEDLTVAVSGCAGTAVAATATFNGSVAGTPSLCTFHWDFGDGTGEVVTTAPSASHAYARAGTFPAAVTVVCGACVRTTTIDVMVPACCPELTTFAGAVAGCIDGKGRTAAVTFVAATNPAGATGRFIWLFGDGESQTTTVPSVPHAYTIAGPRIAQVTFAPSEPGCLTSSRSFALEIPVCGPGDEPGGGTKPSSCGALVWIIGALLAAAMALTVLTLAWQVCYPPGPPTWLWLVVAGAWLLAGLAIALSYLICSFSWFGLDCPCLTRCDWLQLATMMFAAGAAVASYLATCCHIPLWWAIIAALGALFLAALITWIVACKPTACRVLAALLVAISSAALPAIAYIAFTPLAACASALATGIATTIGGLLALATAISCTSSTR
jgi:hypothetical protein